MEVGVMPKDTIQDTAGSYDVRVGWSTETVQVGIETAEGRSLLTMLYGDQEARIRVAQQALQLVSAFGRHGTVSAGLELLGRQILDIIEASQTEPGSGPSYTGVWSTLDRAGINRLIKTLRRARDAAYGRDE